VTITVPAVAASAPRAATLSKFALEASDALRLELAPFGVRVVLVEPGVIATPLYARAAASVSGDDQALQPYRAIWPVGFGFPSGC